MNRLFGITRMDRLLNDHGMLLARITWLALAAFQLASFVPLLPQYLPLASHPCRESCLLTIQEAKALSNAGIAPRLYVSSLLIVTVVNMVISTTIAVILFTRKPVRPLMALGTGLQMAMKPYEITGQDRRRGLRA